MKTGQNLKERAKYKNKMVEESVKNYEHGVRIDTQVHDFFINIFWPTIQPYTLFFISNAFFQLSLGVAYKKSLFGLKFCLSVAYFMTV